MATGNATILSQEQVEILSSDLSQLIGKIEKLNNSNNNDFDDLKISIKQAIITTINEVRIKEQLKSENFELEENISELKKVKNYYLRCENKSFWKIIVTMFFTSLITIPLTMILTKYLISYGPIAIF